MGTYFNIVMRISFDRFSYTPQQLRKNFQLAKKYKIDEDVEISRDLDNIVEQILTGARYKHDKKKASKNSELTKLIKGHDIPLIDTGNLIYNAIKVKCKTNLNFMDMQIYLDKKDPNYWIYKKLATQDIVIPVTETLRNMFRLLSNVSKGIENPSVLSGRAAELYKQNKIWYPLKDTTTEIIIPRRNYWNVLTKSKKLEKFMIKTMTKILKRTMKTIKTGSAK
jgi:hypothetical protein